MLNFQATPQEVAVTLDEPVRLREILSTGRLTTDHDAQRRIQTLLPPYGYDIYEVL